MNTGLVCYSDPHMVGITDRTTSAPNSAHRLIVDKVQGLSSGILTYTSLVLLQKNVETRVKVFIKFYEIKSFSLSIFGVTKKALKG